MLGKFFESLTKGALGSIPRWGNCMVRWWGWGIRLMSPPLAGWHTCICSFAHSSCMSHDCDFYVHASAFFFLLDITGHLAAAVNFCGTFECWTFSRDKKIPWLYLPYTLCASNGCRSLVQPQSLYLRGLVSNSTLCCEWSSSEPRNLRLWLFSRTLLQKDHPSWTLKPLKAISGSP